MKKSVKQGLIIIIHYVSCLFLLWVSLRLAYEIRFYFHFFIEIFPPFKGIPDWDIYQKALPIIITVWTVVVVFSKYYRQRNLNFYDVFVHIVKIVTSVFFILMALTFMYRDVEYSRLVILLSWLIAIGVLFCFQVLYNSFESWILKKIIGHHRILILGKGKPINFLKDSLSRKKGFKTYFYEQMLDERVLRRFIKRRKIEEIVIMRNDLTHNKLLKIASVCEALDVDFKFVPDMLELRMGELIIDQSFGIPLLQLRSISLYGFDFYFKRVFDIVFSIFIVALTIFPLIIISILIKLETSGSVFFLQKRVGYKSKIFLLYKFRTMIREADSMIEHLKHLSERGGPVFKMKKDPRVTRTGKILRMTSLDEFPQIINVLKGNMSIVGPRPQVVWEAEAYDEKALKRLNILPGVTGLWQVSGRATLSYEDMINLDIYYLENWSPGLDIQIILKTIPTILSRSGAY